jgi:hypothetical protein
MPTWLQLLASPARTSAPLLPLTQTGLNRGHCSRTARSLCRCVRHTTALHAGHMHEHACNDDVMVHHNEQAQNVMKVHEMELTALLL